MMGAETEYGERLKKKLAEAIAESERQINEGFADTFENYRYRVGFRKALVQCFDLCAEVERDMNR